MSNNDVRRKKDKLEEAVYIISTQQTTEGAATTPEGKKTS
jgi:hypothetical protein